MNNKVNTKTKLQDFMVVFRRKNDDIFTYNFANKTIEQAQEEFNYGEAFIAYELNEDSSVGKVIWSA